MDPLSQFSSAFLLFSSFSVVTLSRPKISDNRFIFRFCCFIIYGIPVGANVCGAFVALLLVVCCVVFVFSGVIIL